MDKERDGVKQGVLRLGAELHHRVKVETAQRNTSMRQAIEDGLKLWLNREEEAVLKNTFGALSTTEQKWLTILLTILRSGNREAVEAIQSNLVVFARHVEMTRGGAGG